MPHNNTERLREKCDRQAQTIRRLTGELVKAEAEKWHRLFLQADAAKIVIRERAEKAEALARRAIHAVEELSWLLDSDPIQAACSLAALHGARYSQEHVNRAASAEQAAQDVLADPLVKRLREE